jgi:hypothetical protein
VNAFRTLAAGNRDLSSDPRADRLERLLLLAVGQIGGGAVNRSCPMRRVVTQAHQPVRLVERQGFQQHAIDDAEDRGRRADAKSERQHCRCSEGGLLPEDTCGVAQVLPQIANHVSGWRAQRGWRGHVRLPQRCHLLRQDVSILEVGESEARRVFVRGTSGYQLSVAVFQMLRELLDDLGLASRREP